MLSWKSPSKEGCGMGLRPWYHLAVTWTHSHNACRGISHAPLPVGWGSQVAAAKAWGTLSHVHLCEGNRNIKGYRVEYHKTLRYTSAGTSGQWRMAAASRWASILNWNHLLALRWLYHPYFLKDLTGLTLVLRSLTAHLVMKCLCFLQSLNAV